MLHAFKVLQRLVRKNTDVMMKVLLTCPNQSLRLYENIDGDDILSVPDDVDWGGHGAWNSSASLEDLDALLAERKRDATR